MIATPFPHVDALRDHRAGPRMISGARVMPSHLEVQSHPAAFRPFVRRDVTPAARQRVRPTRPVRPPSRALLLAALLLGYGCAHKPIDSASVPPAANHTAVETALAMVGRPYRYGGNSPRGFDCSGLIQYSYARAGVRLPRSTYGLERRSRPIAVQELRHGDLVFFDQEGKRSSHVGLYIGDSRFVHAPSSGKTVAIGSLANPYWRRHLAGARRVQVD